jgi:hypothetical protein
MDDKLIVEAAISAFVSEAAKSFAAFFKQGKKELDYFFDKNVRRYLKSQYAKNISVKTILKGSTPVYFYDVYFPLSLEYDGNCLVKDNSISILEKTSKVTIIGEAGSGKSMLVKHLFLRQIRKKEKIPINIELRYLPDRTGALFDYMSSNILGLENEYTDTMDRLLRSGRFVFYLDGYDEVSRNKTQVLAKDIDDFVSKYDGNQFVVTSRPYTNIDMMPSFLNIRISKLDKVAGDIDGFIDQQLKNEDELAQEIKKSITSNNSEYIQSFLTNPLLLSLYILTYQSNSTVPNKKSIFYKRVLNALFSEHDSKTKIGFSREQRTGFSQEEFEDILKTYSAITYFKNQLSFFHSDIYENIKLIKQRICLPDFNADDFIYDMLISTSLWVEDGVYISFAHRSIQEYFCAMFISALSDKDKETTYSKIINKDGDELKVAEFQNLISLCEEVDPIGVTLYYKIPILKKLWENVSSQDDHVCSILVFLIAGLDVATKNTGRAIEIDTIGVAKNLIPMSFQKYTHPYCEEIQGILNRMDLKRLVESSGTKHTEKQGSANPIRLGFSEQSSLRYKICSYISANAKETFDDFKNSIAERLELHLQYVKKLEDEKSSIVGLL